MKNPSSGTTDNIVACNESVETVQQQDIYPPSISLKSHKNVMSLDEILLDPGRASRPAKIALIFRGPPGSGKSSLASIIKEQELAMSGQTPTVLSIDDYFLVEKKIEQRGNTKSVATPDKIMIYEYDHFKVRQFMGCLLNKYKKTLQEGLSNFVIVDCWNDQLKEYEEFYSVAKKNGYVVSYKEVKLNPLSLEIKGDS